MTTYKLRQILIHCFLPVISGGVIYLIFRSNQLRMFQWFGIFKVDIGLITVRSIASNYSLSMPGWIIYSLPDALWVYSFTSTIQLYWNGNRKQILIWLICPFLLGPIAEIFQYFNILKGTYDPIDLLLMIISFFASVIFVTNKIKLHEN